MSQYNEPAYIDANTYLKLESAQALPYYAKADISRITGIAETTLPRYIKLIENKDKELESGRIIVDGSSHKYRQDLVIEFLRLAKKYREAELMQNLSTPTQMHEPASGIPQADIINLYEKIITEKDDRITELKQANENLEQRYSELAQLHMAALENNKQINLTLQNLSSHNQKLLESSERKKFLGIF